MIISIINLLVLLLILLLLIFLFVNFLFSIIYRCPFVPSKKVVHEKAIEIAGIKNRDVVYDLGCGDARFLIAVASKFKGIKCVGYEISPFLYLLAKIKTRRYKNIKIIFGNFFKKDISEADIIFCYLLPSIMKKLEKKILKEIKKSLRVVSQDFSFPNIKPRLVIERDPKKNIPKIILYVFKPK